MLGVGLRAEDSIDLHARAKREQRSAAGGLEAGCCRTGRIPVFQGRRARSSAG